MDTGYFSAMSPDSDVALYFSAMSPRRDVALDMLDNFSEKSIFKRSLK